MDKYQENLIDSFLQRRLTLEEEEEFKKLLTKDASFAKEVTLMRHIASAIEKKGESAALNEIKALSHEKEFEKVILKVEKKYHRKTLKSMFTLVSASVACVIIILIYIGNQPQHSTDYLYSKYYAEATFEHVPVRGGELLPEDQQNLKVKAIAAYKEGAYTIALSLFDQLNVEANYRKLPEDVVFYTALCRMKTADYATAIPYLNYLFADGIYFNDQAGWYLALAYLKKDKRKESTVVLEKLIENNAENEQTAKALLFEINKKKLF